MSKRIAFVLVVLVLAGAGSASSVAHPVIRTDDPNDTTNELLDIQAGVFVHCHHFDDGSCVGGGRDRIIGVELTTYRPWYRWQLQGRSFISFPLDTYYEWKYVDRFIHVKYNKDRRKLVARMVKYLRGPGTTEVVGFGRVRRDSRKKVQVTFARRLFGPLRDSGRIGWAIQTNSAAGVDVAPNGYGIHDGPVEWFRHTIRS